MIAEEDGQDFADRPVGIVHEASLLVSCFWCERIRVLSRRWWKKGKGAGQRRGNTALH
jgi:hypothetical protein